MNNDLVYNEKDYCKCLGNSQERKRLHLDFKKKQQDFDAAFRKAKRIYARHNEIEIESMVNANGKKIEQLGPQCKRAISFSYGGYH